MFVSFLRMQESMLIAGFWDTPRVLPASQGGAAQNDRAVCSSSEYSIRKNLAICQVFSGMSIWFGARDAGLGRSSGRDPPLLVFEMPLGISHETTRIQVQGSMSI